MLFNYPLSKGHNATQHLVSIVNLMFSVHEHVYHTLLSNFFSGDRLNPKEVVTKRSLYPLRWLCLGGPTGDLHFPIALERRGGHKITLAPTSSRN